MKKSIFKSISVIICILFLLQLTPLTSQISQAVASDNYQYIVAFNSQGGSTVIDSNADYNTAITAPAIPTKAGYKFVGWYKEAGTINAWNFATDTVTTNTILYAKWIVAIPATPTGVTAVASSYNSIKISWRGVAGATGYQIYRATSSTGTYTLIASPSTITYTNAGLTTNSTYYYKVRAYSLASTVKVYSGFSTIISAKAIPSTPTSVKAVSSSSKSINISWSAVTGASGYEIYRAPSSGGTYTLVSRPSAITYNNIGLTTNSTYYYKVRAYRLLSTVRVYSGFSTTISAKPIIPPPVQSISYIYGNTSGNLTNGGGVVSDGQYTYYRNSSDGYKLYKSKPDGSAKSKVSDSVCGSLNIAGDWIYYSGSWNSRGIYKMKKDGSSKTLIANSQTMGIAVVNDWIYYLEEGAPGSQEKALYKIKIDGKSKTKINFGTGTSLICVDPQDIVVIENWVYLSLYNKVDKSTRLSRVKTDGSTAQKVLNSNPRFFSIADGWIYYADKTYQKISKAKVDGSSEKLLYTTPYSNYGLYSINVSNGYVYFSNDTESQPTDKLGIYRMKTDGSQIVQLVKGAAKFLKIASDWIYFESPSSSSPTYSNGVFKVIVGSSQILKLKTDGSQLLQVK